MARLLLSGPQSAPHPAGRADFSLLLGQSLRQVLQSPQRLTRPHCSSNCRRSSSRSHASLSCLSHKTLAVPVPEGLVPSSGLGWLGRGRL